MLTGTLPRPTSSLGRSRLPVMGHLPAPLRAGSEPARVIAPDHESGKELRHPPV